MLKFEIYAGSATLDDLGTLATLVGKRGTLAFIPKNLIKLLKIVYSPCTCCTMFRSIFSCPFFGVKHKLAKKFAVF
jgi:hypothetical protein